LKNAILAAAIVAAAVTSTAQTKSPVAEPQKLTESIEIRVINVDVVVTDRKGNPITGLTKDDFVLLENGQVKPISNFYEVNTPHARMVASAAAPAEAATAAPVVREEIPENQKRRILFYIDNLSLAPFNRNRVFKQMKEFIETVMRPGDEAMIATYNRSMKVRVPFTRDKISLVQMLDVIAGESALGVNDRSDRKDRESQIHDAQSYDDALALARSYAEEKQHDLRNSVESINALMTTLAGVEGKKVLVLTSEGFPIQPGREIFQYLDEYSHEKGWSMGSSQLEGMSYDAKDQIQSIAQTANANGITLYTIHAGGLDAANTTSAENARPTSFAVAQAAVSNSTDSLAMMADMTGGLASLGTNNFALAFERINKDLDSYYSLGYRAGTERVDRQRSIQVRLRNNPNRYSVRARQTFVEKSTYAEMNDRVIANLLYKTKANDLHIEVRSGQPRAADEDLFRVPVEVQIPLDALTLLPQGDDYVGGFDLYVVVSNKDGDMSDVSRKSQQIRVPAKDFATLKNKYYTYALDLLMENGPGKISIGVMDQVSNVSGFSNTPVMVKDLR
jgi:VWFA-related protein